MMSASVRPGGDRALLVLEVVVGLGVVAAIIGRAYGAFPTLAFVLCGGAVAYTGWVGSRMLSALRDPTLDVSGRRRDFEREKLEGEKRLLLQGIKDLEADRQTGKMNEAEYQKLRVTAEARAVEIIRMLRESDERWSAEAEALVKSRLGDGGSELSGPTATATAPEAPEGGSTEIAAPARASDAPAADARLFPPEAASYARAEGKLACRACAFHNDDDARFCAGCGRALGQEEAA